MEFLDGLPPWVALVVVGGLVFAESALVVGLVLPAATALIALGLLANAGAVPIGAAVPVAIVAALAGGNVAFRSRSFRPDRRADKLFTRYGGRAIFLAQWIVGARTLMPRLAARNGVSHRRFVAYHAPAAVLWAVWMVGASYLAGASYHLVVARLGRAGGALALFAAVLVVLVLTGRRLARVTSWRPAGSMVDLAVSVAALTVLAALLVLVIPVVVRFSGLADADVAVASWARGEWTSDGYLFALRTALFADPAVLFAAAAVVCLLRWWRRGAHSSRLAALGPVLPVVVLAAVLAVISEPAWRAPSAVVFPPVTEVDAAIPFTAVAPMAAEAAGHTAQLAAAMGLLAWLLAGRGPHLWRIAVWTVAGVYVAGCAGCWIYLGWSRTSETAAAVLVGAAWAVLNAAIWSAPRAPARFLEVGHAGRAETPASRSWVDPDRGGMSGRGGRWAILG